MNCEPSNRKIVEIISSKLASISLARPHSLKPDLYVGTKYVYPQQELKIREVNPWRRRKKKELVHGLATCYDLVNFNYHNPWEFSLWHTFVPREKAVTLRCFFFFLNMIMIFHVHKSIICKNINNCPATILKEATQVVHQSKNGSHAYLNSSRSVGDRVYIWFNEVWVRHRDSGNSFSNKTNFKKMTKTWDDSNQATENVTSL